MPDQPTTTTACERTPVKRHVDYREQTPCPRCGAYLRRLTAARFADGTRHVREDCAECGRHVRWAPRTSELERLLGGPCSLSAQEKEEERQEIAASLKKEAAAQDAAKRLAQEARGATPATWPDIDRQIRALWADARRRRQKQAIDPPREERDMWEEWNFEERWGRQG